MSIILFQKLTISVLHLLNNTTIQGFIMKADRKYRWVPLCEDVLFTTDLAPILFFSLHFNSLYYSNSILIVNRALGSFWHLPCASVLPVWAHWGQLVMSSDRKPYKAQQPNALHLKALNTAQRSIKTERVFGLTWEDVNSWILWYSHCLTKFRQPPFKQYYKI